MARIKRLWLFTVTSTQSFAGTQAPLRLKIISQDDRPFKADLGDPGQDDRECGQTGCHELVFSEEDGLDDTQINEVLLQIHDSDNAWMPKSIWVICENIDGDFKLLSANPDWHSWFDPESRPGYTLRLMPSN